MSYELEAKITFELQPHRREGAVKGNPNFCDDYQRLGYCPCGKCHGYVCDLCGRISIDYWVLNYRDDVVCERCYKRHEGMEIMWEEANG